ncbi:hypothetical protein Aduo_014069 [Ancylostoma duodenale]
MRPFRLALLFLFFASFLPASGRKLTTEENEQNAERCGVHFLGEGKHFERRPAKRSFGGRQFEQDEYPWTVFLILSGPRNTMLCSGVQISPRHILTAAHCALEFDTAFNDLQCGLNNSYSAVSVMRDPKHILVFIGSNKEKPNNGSISERFKVVHRVSKLTVHNFDHCRMNNDLALIELSQNISEAHSTPICMPSEDLQLHGVLYASGSGSDPGLPRTLTDPRRESRGQQVVTQQFYGVDESSQKILTVAFSKSPFHGDSGGPLFQVDESEAHTLVGITSYAQNDDIRKSDTGENYITYYAYVPAYLDWICKHSGVCPVEETSSEEKSPLDPRNSKRKDQAKIATINV